MILITAVLLVPPELAEGVRAASPRQLAEIRILGPGTALSWPALDVQLSVTGLLAELVEERAWVAEMGRAGGSVSPPRNSAPPAAMAPRGASRERRGSKVDDVG